MCQNVPKEYRFVPLLSSSLFVVGCCHEGAKARKENWPQKGTKKDR